MVKHQGDVLLAQEMNPITTSGEEKAMWQEIEGNLHEWIAASGWKSMRKWGA